MVLLTIKVVPLSWYNTLAVIKQQVAKVIFTPTCDSVLGMHAQFTTYTPVILVKDLVVQRLCGVVGLSGTREPRMHIPLTHVVIDTENFTETANLIFNLSRETESVSQHKD